LIATACLRKWGGFDERYFAYFDDAEICLRYQKEGGRVGIVTSASVLHEGGKGDPMRFYYNVRNHFLILRDYGTFLFPPFAQLRVLSILLRYLAFLVLRRPCPIVPGIAMIWNGYWDYRKARWGQFDAK
jgi:GT2 family glycosyltransferase